MSVDMKKLINFAPGPAKLPEEVSILSFCDNWDKFSASVIVTFEFISVKTLAAPLPILYIPLERTCMAHEDDVYLSGVVHQSMLGE